MFKNLLFGGSSPASIVADLGLTVLRVFAGLSLALAHGWGKLPPPEPFIRGVGNLGFPAPTVFAWAAALAEFVGGILLACGLLTRFAGLSILITMAVAGFLRHADDPYRQKELAFLFGAVALAYMLAGSGRYSVDRIIRGRN